MSILGFLGSMFTADKIGDTVLDIVREKTCQPYSLTATRSSIRLTARCAGGVRSKNNAGNRMPYTLIQPPSGDVVLIDSGLLPACR